MKTIFELPDDLVFRLKLRTLRDRLKLRDLEADVMRAGLESQLVTLGVEEPSVVVTDTNTGVPVVQCRRVAPKEFVVTRDRVAKLLRIQEVTWHSRW